MSDRIQVASGKVTVPEAYEGPVTVFIDDEFHCPDIYVYFEEDLVLPKVEHRWGGLYDCKPFCKAVAELIAKQNDLGEGEYNLDRAELGMQGDAYCAFEGFSKDGKDISTEFSESKGAVNLNAIEEEKCRKREAELDAMMTPEQRVQMDKAFLRVRELTMDLRKRLESVAASFRVEVSLYFGDLLGFPNDYAEGHRWDSPQDDEYDLRRHFAHQLLIRLKENVRGHFHSPESGVLEIRIDDEDDLADDEDMCD